MKWLNFFLLAILLVPSAASAEIAGKTFNTGESEEVDTVANTLNIFFENCDFDESKICGRVKEIVLPDGSILEEDSVMPDGSVLQGSYMITGLVEESEGSYRKGQILAPDEALRDGKMKYYGFRVDENADGTITAAGCILTICPRKMIWRSAN